MDPSRQPNPEEISTIENIINILSSSSSLLSQVMVTASKRSIRNNSTDNNSGSSNSNNNDHEYLLTHKQLDKIWRDLKQIIVAFNKLREIKDDAVGPSKSLNSSLDYIREVVAGPSTDFSIKKVQANLSTLKDDAMKLKSNIPLWQPKKSNKNSGVIRYSISKLRNEIIIEVDDFSSLRMYGPSSLRWVFSEYQELFEELSIGSKLCCLSFTVFPANVVLKGRLLIDWWVGERLVDLQDSGNVLTELVVKGFIEPVKESHKLVADRFKMQPLMHHEVLMFATAEFSVKHLNGIQTVNSIRCNRAFLVETDYGNLELSQLTKELHDLDQEELQTIFNINDPFPDQRFELFAKRKNVNIVDWFSKMKNVNALYLGRWQSQHHIEVQSTEFLKGLKNMGCLRLLSLQGISRINELPNSIGKLKNLRILDLKACHNLEVLPDEIVSLKKLLRLDISECYLLDDMPKGLASLSELQVLKGLLLSKLSINTSSKAFPREKELRALGEMKALRKLAIAWGGKTTEKENAELTSVGIIKSDNIGDNKSQHSSEEKSTRGSNRLSRKLTMNPDAAGLPTGLEKLELQCFPCSNIPNWLIHENLKSLKKLHIKGGKKLENLGPNVWTVEILRLKYLRKFYMFRDELQISFPNLRLLENVECPELSSCPQGVWLNEECKLFDMDSPLCC
ncbi:disease resistance RPP13-like protein 4 [Quercus robur]|uniref:disease resistance RPP13-like protein 4 n=1 Tax=Quercus robur TaxID=38942 RepID=UPI002162D8E4|nr:disease resistance RPP13-like protein 4 [Quercus robur]